LSEGENGSKKCIGSFTSIIWEYNIKMKLRYTCYKDFFSTCGQMTGFCERGNERSGSITIYVVALLCPCVQAPRHKGVEVELHVF
jgi:hypothetical protein